MSDEREAAPAADPSAREAAPVADGRRLVVLAQRVYERQQSQGLPLQAAGGAFWLIISVVPLGIALVNVLGLVFQQREVVVALGKVTAGLPGTFGQLLTTRLETVAQDSPGTGVADAVLVLFALWTISNASGSLLEGVRTTYGVPRRPWLARRSIALLVAVVGVLAACLALALALATDRRFTSAIASIGTFVVVAVLLVALYRVGSRWQAHWRFCLVGGVGAAIGLWAIGSAFAVYVRIAPTLTAMFGGVAGLAATMLAAYFGCLAILLGAVANVEWQALTDDEGAGQD